MTFKTQTWAQGNNSRSRRVSRGRRMVRNGPQISSQVLTDFHALQRKQDMQNISRNRLVCRIPVNFGFWHEGTRHWAFLWQLISSLAMVERQVMLTSLDDNSNNIDRARANRIELGLRGLSSKRPVWRKVLRWKTAQLEKKKPMGSCCIVRNQHHWQAATA